MNFYKVLFCISKLPRFLLVSLAVWFFILLSVADAQQVYDVHLTNGSIDVNILNPETFSDALFQGNTLEFSSNAFGDDSPMDSTPIPNIGSAYGSAEADFGTTSEFTLPSTSFSPMAPGFGGRNPSGFSGMRYFQLGIANVSRLNRSTFYYNNSPLAERQPTGGAATSDNYHISAVEQYPILNPSSKSTFFNYNNFKNDIVSALIGPDNFQFFTRLIQILNATSSSTNFTYRVPAAFGFDAGFTIDIPFNDILHGTGSWYSFSTIVSLFRSLMSFAYYYAVCVLIYRTVFIHN